LWKISFGIIKLIFPESPYLSSLKAEATKNMSGPIIRRYGFPNFEKIFGDRPIEHGIEEGEPAEAPAVEAGTREPKPEEHPPAQGDKAKEPGKS
jgi:hypothetical protein